MNINTCLIQPFCIGDRVDLSRHHIMLDSRVTTGVVTDCIRDTSDNIPGYWMVRVTLDNGRKVGVRPSYVDLLV